MDFSGSRWACLILADILIRFVIITVGTLYPLGIVLSLPYSLVHLMALFCSALCVLPRAWRPWSKFAVTIIATNILFLLFVFYLQVWFNMDGFYTSCTGSVCDWQKGQITADGIKSVIGHAVVQVTFNVVLVLFFWLESQVRDRATAD
jgi:hypothetical protein